LLRRRRARDPLEELTAEERTVLELMAEGSSDEAICERLSLSAEQVAGDIAAIFAKLGLQTRSGGHSRVQAVLTYLQR